MAENFILYISRKFPNLDRKLAKIINKIMGLIFFYKYDTNDSKRYYFEISEKLSTPNLLYMWTKEYTREIDRMNPLGELIQKPYIFMAREAGDYDDFAYFYKSVLDKHNYKTVMICAFSPSQGGYTACAFKQDDRDTYGIMGSLGITTDTGCTDLQGVANSIFEDCSHYWTLTEKKK